MIRRMAVTVRRPGARIAPVRSPLTCGHTGREKTGAKTPMALRRAIGKESMAILAAEENTRLHCRSIVTQIVINGQSRAKRLFEKYQAASRLSIKRVIATYTNVSLVLGNSS